MYYFSKLGNIAHYKAKNKELKHSKKTILHMHAHTHTHTQSVGIA